jgi:hypothetical protein
MIVITILFTTTSKLISQNKQTLHYISKTTDMYQDLIIMIFSTIITESHLIESNGVHMLKSL